MGPIASPSSSVTPRSSSTMTPSPSSTMTPSPSSTITPGPPSTITPGPSKLTAFSSTLTSEKVQAFDASVSGYRASQTNAEGENSFEVELLVNHLRQSRVQVLKSADMDLEYKKLLDALIKIVIEQFYSLHEERDWFTEFVSRKIRVVFLSFVLWIIAVSAVFFFCSGVQRSYDHPPST